MVLVRPVDLDRIGIGEQLVRIEPEAALRRVVAVGAKTIARASGKAGGEHRKYPFAFRPQLQPFDLARAGVIEDRHPQASRRR